MGKKATAGEFKKKFEKLFLQRLKGAYLRFLKKNFSPKLKENPLSAYTSIRGNDRSFPHMCPMKKKIPENNN
jgi:hypothetical protein